MSSVERQKLMKFDKVNERRARRLLKDFGSYEAVMNATYDELISTHYIGKKTAKEIYHNSSADPASLL